MSLPTHLLAKFCGAHSGEPELMEMAAKFVRVSDWQESENSKNPGSISHPRSKMTPRRPKKGLGEAWLKIFSEYKGDACLLFPFRTAASPRGSVTYNFKRVGAPRAMCTMVNKLPPEGKSMALHRCGNGHLGCVTPKHLYWGDRSDNARDAHRHVRDGKPEAKLDVALMRRQGH